MRAEPAAFQDFGHQDLFLAPLVGLHAVRLIALAQRAGAQGLIHLAREQRWAEQLARAVTGLSPDLEVHVLLPWDCLPYDSASPSRDVMGQRMSVLRQMAAPAKGPRLLITSPAAIVQRVPPRELWASATFSLRTGDSFIQETLENFLHRSGYMLDERVDEPGEAAIRGQVIDLFLANCPQPYRAEHDGSSILSIRRYDPVSQRTEEDVDSITLEPASEVVLSETSDGASSRDRHVGIEHRLPDYYRQLETVFDYWPDAEMVMEERAEERRRNVMEQIVDAHESRNSFRAGAEYAVKPELNIGLMGTIPESYIDDPETRINLYARISRLDSFESVEDLEAGIEDRFGALPQSLQNLIKLAELKQLCLRLGITRIDASSKAIALAFRPGAADILPLDQAIEGSGDELRWRGERLILSRSIEEPNERLELIAALLSRIS